MRPIPVILFFSIATIALLLVASCTLVSLQRASNEKLVHHMLSYDVVDQGKYNEVIAIPESSPPLSNTKTQTGSASWSDTKIVSDRLSSALGIITVIHYCTLSLLLVVLIASIVVQRRGIKQELGRSRTRSR